MRRIQCPKCNKILTFSGDVSFKQNLHSIVVHYGQHGDMTWEQGVTYVTAQLLDINQEVFSDE